MNKFIIVGLTMMTQIGYTQIADRQLISSAGQSAILNDLVFDWSLGEVIIDQSIVINKKNLNYNTLITPGDGSKNETLIFDNISQNVELNIFDKWGNILFQRSNYTGDWDGHTSKGEELPDGVYIYVLQTSDRELLKKGTVTIKRK